MPLIPNSNVLSVSEIFWSFQGEGARAGHPSIFLRLNGCSLKCSYCDTKEAQGTGTFMELDAIMAGIESLKKKYPLSQVVITGGEPLEQDLAELVYALKKKKLFISIETNGLHFQELKPAADWWTAAPKDVTNYRIHSQLLKHANEIKLIVKKSLTIDVIKRIRQQVPGLPIFLQPNAHDQERYKNTFSLYCKCQEEGLKLVKPGLQLHRVYRVS